MKDVVIVGTGTAGMSAAVYAKRYELDIVVVGEVFGGTVTKTHLIENWLGIPSISGFELGMSFVKHAQSLGTEIRQGRVGEVIQKDDGTFITILSDGSQIPSRTVIYTAGSEHRELGLESEQRLKGKGVSYCATCDGAFFKGKVVGIVGGSDSAVKESLLLAEYASKVYILYRGETPRAEPINMKRMRENSKITLISGVNVSEVLGEDRVSGVRFDTGESLELQGLFIEIGSDPNTAPLSKLGLALSEKGEIIIDQKGNTNIQGFFAGGDIVNNSFRQAIVSAAQGAHCANQSYEFLSENS